MGLDQVRLIVVAVVRDQCAIVEPARIGRFTVAVVQVLPDLVSQQLGSFSEWVPDHTQPTSNE